MTKLFSKWLVLTLAALTLFSNGAEAQAVRIQNGLGEWGYGWMFRHAGSCHVALPLHVAGPLPRVTIATTGPVVTDQAIVQKEFWPDMDLALAFVEPGPLLPRCTAELSDLGQTPRTRTAAEAMLLRVSPLGDEERVPIRIVDRKYLTLDAEVVDPEDVVAQGTSGAFAFVGSTPIGMALTSDDPTRLTLLRAEEIEMNLARLIAQQGVAFRAVPGEAEAGTAADVRPGYDIVEISANSPATLPQFSVDNLTGPGFYVTEPQAPVEITLRLDGPTPRSVGRVRLFAPGGDYAVPRDIAVFLDASEAGDRFRFWTQGRMTADGRFDTGALAFRNARWVRILLRDTWTAGTVALDRVTVE